MSERKFSVGLNVVLIILWGIVALFHLIANHNNPVSISFLLLYICYVMGKCNEIRSIYEEDDYD